MFRAIAAHTAVVEAYAASVVAVGEPMSREFRALVVLVAAVWAEHPEYARVWAAEAGPADLWGAGVR